MCPPKQRLLAGAQENFVLLQPSSFPPPLEERAWDSFKKPLPGQGLLVRSQEKGEKAQQSLLVDGEHDGQRGREVGRALQQVCALLQRLLHHPVLQNTSKTPATVSPTPPTLGARGNAQQETLSKYQHLTPLILGFQKHTVIC